MSAIAVIEHFPLSLCHNAQLLVWQVLYPALL
jgi:hypothetical protein